MGLPTSGAFAAWAVGLRSWRRARDRIPPGLEVREARGRMIPLVVLPTTLIVYGLVVSLLVLGETVPDVVAQPAALAYGVPGLLSGLGMAIVYRRGIPAAVASKQGFGRVLPLVVIPEASAVFGLVVSFFLIGRGSDPAGVPRFGVETVWPASAMSMFGGVGGPVGARLAASAWDFETAEAWAIALAKGTRGGIFTMGCFGLAMAVLGEWLIVLLLVLYFGVTLAFGLVLFVRVRRRRSGGMRAA